MQKARGHPPSLTKRDFGLPPLVGTRFQDLFHPPPGVLFIFPSRYLFAIGHGRVFSLGRWSCRIQSGFHVSRPTQGWFGARGVGFAYGAVTLSGFAFQSNSTHRRTTLREPADSRAPPCNPAEATAAALAPPQFGLFPVRSPLLRESRLFSLPRGT